MRLLEGNTKACEEEEESELTKVLRGECLWECRRHHHHRPRRGTLNATLR